MDKKEFSLIVMHHRKLINREFDEHDVYSLLILLRPHSKKNSPLHELSDFIAHREKDRGKIHRYLSKSKKEIIKATKNQAYKLTIKEIFSEHDLTESINEVFQKYGLEEIDAEIGSAIMLCVMSLLQFVKLIENNKPTASLFLSIPSDAENITLLSRIPIPHSSGKGEVYMSFAVLRTSYKPSGLPDQSYESGIFQIVNNNKIMNIQLNTALKTLKDESPNS